MLQYQMTDGVTDTVEKDTVQRFNTDVVQTNIKRKEECFCNIYTKGLFKIKLIYAISET